jgi:replicative superfamily II helicase
MQRPVYKDDEFRILEFLITRTADGWALRKVLEQELRIPQGSMTYVLKDLANRGLVRRFPWTRNRERVEITDQGRDEYNRLIAQRLSFPIPFAVERYLKSRLPDGKLFPVQQNFVDRGLIFSKDNVCVFGYPGSGKTLVAEMVMANEIHNGGKALYVTPYKALDWQKYTDFCRWFGQQTQVVIFDGDHRVPIYELENAGIIIGTYEAIYGALRKGEPWVSGATTIIADEISLLGEDRGGTVDLLITELMSKSRPRIITLSSLVGNPLEIAQWLNAVAVFENRPAPGIKLCEYIVYASRQKHAVFVGRNGETSKQEMDGNLLHHIVKSNLAKNETSLVFVGSRPETQFHAHRLKKLCKRDDALTKEVNDFLEREKPLRTELITELCEMIESGVAFHHAGLQRKARRFVERLMNEGRLKVVVATTTLSHGVDYRVDSVIVDLRSISDVKSDLQGYEYINLKGRTGRFEKSRNASVYLICHEKEANNAFKRYFIESPEAIIPETTFDADRLSSRMLLEAGRSDITPTSLYQSLKGTFGFKCKLLTKKKLTSMINELVSTGFLSAAGRNYKITELGKKSNEVGLTPFEMTSIADIPSDANANRLLEVASSIDLARKIRTSMRALESNSALKVLSNWLKGKSIDEVRAESRGYDDQDILDLVKYTATSLGKMGYVVSKLPLKRRIGSLKRRLDRSLVRIGFMSTR